MKRTTASIRTAFFVPANLLALMGAAGASILTHDASAAVVALGLEALYLVVVVELLGRWVQRTDSRDCAFEPLFKELSPSQREHYSSLRELRDQIQANDRKLPGGWVLERLLEVTGEKAPSISHGTRSRG